MSNLIRLESLGLHVGGCGISQMAESFLET